jgi:hypothetical protein
MDCLRSFNITIAQQANWPAPQFKSWSVGAQHFWLLDNSVALGNGSKYNIQGFKNINIFKIEVTGEFYSSALPVNVSAITNNWNVWFYVDGLNSTSVGNIQAAPNPFGMLEFATQPLVSLSKFQNSIVFETPIQSAKNIEMTKIYAEGIADESLISAQLAYVFTVTVFYKYEGE